MAENKNKKTDDNKKDENDPFNFFKFAGPDNNGKKDDKNKKPRIHIFPLILLTLLVVAFIDYFMIPKADNYIDYSVFRDKVASGEITYVEIGENVLVGYGQQPEADTNKDSGQKGIQLFLIPNVRPAAKQYKTTAVLLSNFIEMMEEKGVHYKFASKQNNYFVQLILSWVIPFAIVYLIWFLLWRKIGGGAGMGSIFGAGQSRAKTVEEGKIKTRFEDVAGVDEAKEELVEVVSFLKEPKKYTDIGGKIPKGVLLVGPPGTGKTLLARAVAGEAGVPFFSISGSDFVEMFVGVGASRVRDLFKQAREKAPCIVFIDEIDALGKSRVNGFGGGNDEREQTLNQLLVEMDGFENEKGLIILAATNRADILDPALLRPGRFDRQVPVEKPDVKGREAILRIHSKGVKIEDNVDYESLAHGTTGFAGADLANVVNEAALLAVRNGRKKVTMEDFNEAIDKVSIGLKKKTRKENEKEMRLVSVHETGHALVAAFTEGHEPVNKITVVPRSHGIGGFTQYREEEEKFFETQKDMINDVDSCLGGRAAEQILLGEISTGACNDIARATEIVKRMIVDFGMSEKFKNMTLGKGVLGNRGGEPNIIREFSEQTQNYIDEEIARIMDERYKHVVKLLSDHKDLLEYISKRLLEVETMEGKEFYEIIKGEAHCKQLEASAKKADTEKTADKKEKASETKTKAKKPAAEKKPVKRSIKKPAEKKEDDGKK